MLKRCIVTSVLVGVAASMASAEYAVKPVEGSPDEQIELLRAMYDYADSFRFLVTALTQGIGVLIGLYLFRCTHYAMVARGNSNKNKNLHTKK